MYKFLVIVLLMSVFGTASAIAADTVPSFSGTYDRRGELSVAQVQLREVVYSGSEAGRAELSELRSAGYSCEAKPRQFWLCRKFADVNTVEVPRSLVERAEAILQQNLELSFGELRATPQLIFGGPEFQYAEWKIPQGIMIGSSAYLEFRFARTKYSDGMSFDKIRMGSPETSDYLEFLRVNENEFTNTLVIRSDRYKMHVVFFAHYYR